MAIYAISDLHLSKSVNKPMDVFGPLWHDYENRILQGFEKLTEDDITIIPGDISWAMSLSESLLDFKSIVMKNINRCYSVFGKKTFCFRRSFPPIVMVSL